jgi:hypothetical protein
VAFDVVETLFSLAPVEEALRPVGVPLPLFFTRLLRDGFALAAAGGHKPFREVAASALRGLAPRTGTSSRGFNGQATQAALSAAYPRQGHRLLDRRRTARSSD